MKCLMGIFLLVPSPGITQPLAAGPSEDDVCSLYVVLDSKGPTAAKNSAVALLVSNLKPYGPQ